MHVREGELRTFLDGELTPVERSRVQHHLSTCPTCQRLADDLAHGAQRVNARLSSLQPGASHPLPVRPARARLQARLEQADKETLSMFQKLSTRISRPMWAGMTLIAVLAVALAFPSVRAAANSFLRLFRVEQVRVLDIDTNRMPGMGGNSQNLEALFAENATMTPRGEAQPAADAAEAAALSGLPVRLPSALGQPDDLSVQPGGSLVFNMDLELARAALKDLGRGDITLPDNLDNAQITIEMLASVNAAYGDCAKLDEMRQDENRDPDMPLVGEIPDCTVFAMLPSPTVDAPVNLDLRQMGEIYLQFLGMTEEEAADYAATVDWTTTFIVPVPMGNSTHKTVQVDGVQGTLISYYEGMENAYMLLWVKDGIVYTLAGIGDGEKALGIAASLK